MIQTKRPSLWARGTGVTFFGWWTVPAFSSGAATAVMGILSATYVINHKWQGGQAPEMEDLRAIRDQFDGLVDAVKSEEDRGNRS